MAETTRSAAGLRLVPVRIDCRVRRRRLHRAAAAVGMTVSPATAGLLADLSVALAETRATRVGILTVGKRPALARVLRESDPSLTVTVHDSTRLSSAFHAQLTAAGPFDVLVDATRHGPGRDRRFVLSFLHVRPGGSYFVLAPDAGRRAARAAGSEPVAALVRRLCRSRLATDLVLPEFPDPAERTERDERALAARIGSVARHHRHLWVRRSDAGALAKLREEQANAVLRSRGAEMGSFRRHLPAQRFESRCVLRESPSSCSGEMPTSYRVPAMYVRDYFGAVCSPGQLVTYRDAVLPDSFRHNQRRRLGNRFLDDVAPAFADSPHDLTPERRLEGSYFYLDSEFRGHFGHALTEQVARMWAWPEAKQTHPELKALVAVNPTRDGLADFELDLFAACGIAPDDIEMVAGPTEVEHLVAATPMLDNPRYVHPDLTRTWDRLGEALVQCATDRDYPARIFCSRRAELSPASFGPNRRVCHNAAELEALFAAHGFTIVHAEDHSLADQARLFRAAEVVAGYAGSAMFNLIFAGAPKQVLLVSSESYTAKNEHVIASAAGHRLDIAWCQADIPRGRPGDTVAFNSAFTFDFDREGRFLRGVLAGL